MKNHLKTFWAFALILGFAVQSYAQDSARTKLDWARYNRIEWKLPMIRLHT